MLRCRLVLPPWGLALATALVMSLTMFMTGCGSEPAQVSGQVVDLFSGQPIAGATVEAAARDRGLGLGAPAVLRAVSDAQGGFVLKGLAPGRAHILVASKPGCQTVKWSRAELTSARPGQGQELPEPLKLIQPGQRPPGLPEKIVNELGMEFVLIPAGGFVMGSDEGGAESPAHPVRISQPFYMQTTEVTQRQINMVLGKRHSRFKDCGMDCPADRVPWPVAQAFVARLNQREGGDKYRLPSEAQWEYACRAGSQGHWSWGEDPGLRDEYAWVGENSEGRPHPVGLLKPNPWGLYDLHGNVWEWCADAFDPTYYGRSPIEDPPGPPGDEQSDRVMRGGSWHLDVGWARSANRFRFAPTLNNRGYIGFRVVRSAP